MDIFIILLGTVLFSTSIILKFDVLYMTAFLVAVFNDFIRMTKIKKKQDERGTDEKLTANLFDEKAIKVLKNSNVHTFQIHCSIESGKIYAMLYGGINDMDAFLKVHHMLCSLIDNMKTMRMINEK